MAAQIQLSDGLARLFDSGDYSDLIVKCGGREWNVHQAVLCPRSQYFTNACKDSFQEGFTHAIELEEDDPDVLHQVLKACYSGTYDDSVGSDNKLDFTARIYATAENNDIPFLKTLAGVNFRAQLKEPMDTPRFRKAVQTIYTTTLSSDRGLRDLLVPVLRKHGHTLSKDDGYLNLIKSGFADGDFVADVIAALSRPKTRRGLKPGRQTATS